MASGSLRSASGCAMIISDGFLPHDFVLLHELGHLYYGDYAQRKRFLSLGAACSTYWFYYLLKYTSKLNFTKRLMIGSLASLSIGKLAFNKQNLDEEIRVDDFAITRLKEHKDLEGLVKGKEYFLKFQPFEEKEVDSRLARVGISSDTFKAVQSKSKFAGDVLCTWVVSHPTTEARIEKIDHAIADLRAQEIREIKE